MQAANPARARRREGQIPLNAIRITSGSFFAEKEGFEPERAFRVKKNNPVRLFFREMGRVRHGRALDCEAIANPCLSEQIQIIYSAGINQLGVFG